MTRLSYSLMLCIIALLGAYMKKGIHPKYHEITVVLTNGESFKTRSTYGKPGDSIKLDVDPTIHPAWTGVHRALDSGGKLSRFQQRFKNLKI